MKMVIIGEKTQDGKEKKMCNMKETISFYQDIHHIKLYKSSPKLNLKE
jgi:hypothetical protein